MKRRYLFAVLYTTLATLAALLFLLTAAAGQRAPFLPGAQPRRGMPQPLRPPDSILVRFRPAQTLAGLRGLGRLNAQMSPHAGGLAARPALNLRKEIPRLGIFVYRLSAPGQIDAALAQIKAMPEVLYAEPAHRILLLSDPNDFYFDLFDSDPNHVLFPPDTWQYQWPLHFVNASQAWSIYPGTFYTATTKPRNALKVAVIDTGIDTTHPDFINAGGNSTDARNGGQLDLTDSGNLVNGGNNPAPADPSDDYGHGTHVSGIIGAATNNSIGVAALGFNAQIMMLKVTDPSGDGDDADVVDAIIYAADHGALVINLSLAVNGGYSQALQDAVNYCWGKNTLVVAAAGNDGVDYVRRYPAACDKVLAVGATMFGSPDTIPDVETLASYSNQGLYVGIAAPGGDATMWNGGDLGLVPELYTLIWSTTPTYPVVLTDAGITESTYGYLNGTSMASPHVAGLAALYAGFKGFTQQTTGAPGKIIQALQRGSENLGGRVDGGWTQAYGHGRIDALATLQEHLGNGRPVNTPGCITGQVTYQGTPVMNAAITATNNSTARQYGASSKEDGTYRIANVPAGTYSVKSQFFNLVKTSTVVVTAGCDAVATDYEMDATQISVTITPHTVNVPLGGTQAFSATVTGTANLGIIWSVVQGPGTIGSDGVYHAPTSGPTPQNVEIQATSLADQTRFDTAAVTITAVGVTISPTNPTITAGDVLPFSATVTNASDTSVTWSIAPTTGSIAPTGPATAIYTSPGSVGAQTQVTVTATSNADPTHSASTVVTINPASNATGIVTGVVLNTSRQAIQGAEAHLFDLAAGKFIAATATSDGTGFFQITGVPPGKYHIGAYKSGLNQWIFSPNFQGWQVNNGQTTGPIEIVLEATGVATGGIQGFCRYDDANGSHPIGAGVHIDVYSGGHLVTSTNSDGTGHYAVGGLFSINNFWGWYTYVATWNGHTAAGVNFGVWAPFTIRTDVVFRL